jgi:hypothetical protein
VVSEVGQHFSCCVSFLQTDLHTIIIAIATATTIQTIIFQRLFFVVLVGVQFSLLSLLLQQHCFWLS